MNSLLENQKVQKRRPVRLETLNSSFGLSTNGVSPRKKLRQQPGQESRPEPRQKSWQKPAQKSSRNKLFRKSSKKASKPAGMDSFYERKPRFIDGTVIPRPKFNSFVIEKPKERAERRPLPFLVVPALPIMALALLALGLFFTFYGQGVPDWISRDAVTSEEQGSQLNLARYAGVYPAETAEVTLGTIPLESRDEDAEEIPLDLMETFAWQDYKVQKGDSVSKIALDFSISMDAIIASNGITNVRSLREGAVLRIPNMDGIPYTVKAGDSLSKISQSMGVPLEAILDANDIQSDVINAGMTLFIPGARMNREELRLALGELFVYPVKGARLSSPFGWRNDPFTGVRRHHAAVDLSAPQGTPVWAAMEGKVVALNHDRTYGNFIILSHPGGYQTMYAHLHSTSVKLGDSVAQGVQIAAVGNTGYSTGPHLHFALFRNGRAMNPLDYLNPQR